MTPPLLSKSIFLKALGSKLVAKMIPLLLMIFGVFCASRMIVRALPGDPLETLLAETGTSVSREAMRAELHFDQPFFSAVWTDLKNATRGDFGSSILSRQPVAPVLQRSFIATVKLTVVSMILALSISLSLGLGAAGLTHPRLRIACSRICSAYGALSAALPTPWLGPILTYLLAVKITLFPLGNHLALPALTLAIGMSGIWARLIRERVTETLQMDFANAARARGVHELVVVIKYGLAPCSGTLLAYLGTQFGALLGGAIVAEVIFDWPGMGSLLVQSVLRRDYPVVEACIFVTSTFALLGISLGDWLQLRMTPQLRDSAT